LFPHVPSLVGIVRTVPDVADPAAPIRRDRARGAATELHAASLAAALAALAIAGAGCRHSASGSRSDRVAIHERGEDPGDLETCGELAPGMRATVRGHVSATLPDAFDGYAFVSRAACSLRYRLRPTLPGVDLDLCVVDDESGRVLAVADGEGDEETGSFRLDGARTALAFVVSSAWGSSAYALEIEAVEPESAATPLQPCATKSTLAKLEGYLAPEREPASAPGVRSELAWLAEGDLPAGTPFERASGALLLPR